MNQTAMRQPMTPAEIAARMKSANPFTAEEINERMSEIGAEFGKCRFGDPPNWKALRDEHAYLKSIYSAVLEAGK